MEESQSYNEMFKGCQNTPLLWLGSDIYELVQFRPKSTLTKYPLKVSSKKLRLGNWVERFVAFQLKQQPNIEILAENIQVKRGKETMGELDILFIQENQPIHLEIIYKFYLYDSTKVYENPLRYWIGPNCKDSLIYKLEKLKEKQLPLLFKEETKTILESYKLKPTDFKQFVCFKAQLFVPFENQNIIVNPLNNQCITGTYLNFTSLEQMKDYRFYLPSKLEWLCEPHLSVQWLSFKAAKSIIKLAVLEKRSPMCWIQKKDKSLFKYFITWW